jgi:hypothetical protein
LLGIVMELTGLFLLLLLPPSDATGETATAVETSLRRELGDVAMAIAPDTLVTPAMLQGEKPPFRARFVAHLTWTRVDRATIELVANSQGDADHGYRAARELRFSPEDRKSERGRSIGLVVAGLLREIPAAALALKPSPPVEPAAAAGHPDVAIGGMFAVERPRAGTWPTGPALYFDLPLGGPLRLRTTADVLVGEGFLDIGTAADVRWRFLRSAGDRHGLASGLGILVLRESISVPGDHGGSTSGWNLGLAANLSAHATIWKSLRVVGQAELRALARAMSLTYGDDVPVTTRFSRWRPLFGLGLEYAM